MHTDASHRFERGVDSDMPLVAMERATQLLLSICGGEAGPITHAADKKYLPRRKAITFDKTQIKRVLGITVPASSASALLKRLGMDVALITKGWKVTPPSWRFDISGQHDLVEEVGRCYGFDKIEPTMPSTVAKTGRHSEAKILDLEVKRKLMERGYYEAITYSFVDPLIQEQLFEKGKEVRLANPIADNMSVMRKSLWVGLLGAIKGNLNRQEDSIRLFEMGHVFGAGKKSGQYKEVKKLAAAITGPLNGKHWSLDQREVDFFDLKGDLESLLELSGHGKPLRIETGSHCALHPGQAASILQGHKTVGHIGRLHPAQQQALSIDQPVFLFELDMSVLELSSIPDFSTVSRFPMMQRDIAVLVNKDVDVQKLLDLIENIGGKLLKKCDLFDVYEGERIEKEKKSFAFSLTFQSESSNLTSPEVDAITDKIIGALKEQYGATLRN